jgi:hypothetical protein
MAGRKRSVGTDGLDLRAVQAYDSDRSIPVATTADPG